MLIIFGLLRQPVFHGNPTTYRGKAATWAYGRQLATYDGNTFTYDARGRRTAKNGITFTYDSNGNLIKQSDGLEFLYDHTGVFAVKHNNTTYFYRKDAQANIVALLDNTGAVVVKYRYDAWGKCVIDASTTNTELANLNPFRYRSYYFDTETDFYFLKTRYYDPEIGRFMTIDDISYLDPDSINGLNLYAYCGNNPIMYSDPNGTLKWYHWLGIIGAVIVVAAATVLTFGAAGIAIGGAGLAGAVIHGAAVGALIGAGIGIAGGAIAGGIYSAVTGADFWSSVGAGAMAGFGIGAVVGAVIGGTVGGIHHQQVVNYISQYARNADDATEIYQSFSGKIRLKTSNGRVNAYRYYDNVNAFQRGRYLTNATTNNPIKDLVLYKNNATILAKFNLPKGTQYLVGKIAGSPVNAIQYFVGDPTKLILLV